MSFTAINPATGETIGTFDADTADQIEDKLSRAAQGAQYNRSTSFAERASKVSKAADLVEADADYLASIMTAEMGKTLVEARAEAIKSAKCLRWYAANAEHLLAPHELKDPSTVNASRARTIYQPLGVVLAVMPWNYPMWQVIRFAAPAIMAGNAGLLKHASNVPSTAIYLGELFSRAGFPEGVFQNLMIPASQVESVIRDPRVAAVTLTGSEPAGRAVASAAADEVKKSVLELGGSDPFIVMPSADIDAAVTTAIKSRTTNNGQACINAKRFIVHEDIYDEFAQKFADGLNSLVLGEPTDPGTDVGPVATEKGRQELEDLVGDARDKGAKILAGGRIPEGIGWFYPPTLVAEITRDMRLYDEEAFGPVASLFRVESLDEAITVANDSPFGLGGAFWSQDEDEIEAAIAHIDTGTIAINGMTISYPELPFGGIKRSGFGRELASEGIREFCNLKTVWRA